MDNQLLRKNAKKDMKGFWGKAILLILILMIISATLSQLGSKLTNKSLLQSIQVSQLGDDDIPNIITASVKSTYLSIEGLISLLITALTKVFVLGISWGLLGIVNNSITGDFKSLSFETLISPFNANFIKNFLSIIIKMIVGIAYFLFIIPGIVLSMALMPVDFLLKDKPELSLGETFRESFRLMKGRKMKLFTLLLPVYLIVFLVLAIPSGIIIYKLISQQELLIYVLLLILAGIVITFYYPIKIGILKSEFYRRELVPIVDDAAYCDESQFMGDN
ncbi:MAG: hypothetical protein Q4P34_06260 [Tissierellia bacterium]|nr:hypothetical protein [Tissierellia bacterium]